MRPLNDRPKYTVYESRVEEIAPGFLLRATVHGVDPDEDPWLDAPITKAETEPGEEWTK